MKIMFICTGNICRSAMAEAILKKRISENNLDIEVYSAGTYAENGDVPTSSAINVMQIRGIDLKNHRATNVRNSKIEEMDLILCATKSHKMQTIMLYPNLKDKIYTINEYVEGSNEDIPDPWGYSEEVYESCAKELEKCIDKLVEQMD